MRLFKKDFMDQTVVSFLQRKLMKGIQKPLLYPKKVDSLFAFQGTYPKLTHCFHIDSRSKAYVANIIRRGGMMCMYLPASLTPLRSGLSLMHDDVYTDGCIFNHCFLVINVAWVSA